MLQHEKKRFFLLLFAVACTGVVNAQVRDSTINICADETVEDIKRTISKSIDAINADSMDMWSRNNLGMSYYKFADSANFIKSIEQWDFILKYDSCEQRALINRGICNLFLGNNEAFCEDLKKAKVCGNGDTKTINQYQKWYCSKRALRKAH